MANRDRIGARVAALRKTRGWTARELARRAQVSYSLLAKAETGAVPASPSFIGAVARALGVDVTRITGQPYAEPRSGAALQSLVEPLRRALLAYDLPVSADIRRRPAVGLRPEVAAMSLLGRQARYLQLSQRLPQLLDELTAAIDAADAPRRPELYALLAEAYGGIAGLTHQLGYADLRALALDRIEWAARRSDDPLRVARTQWSRGASLLGAGAYDHGLALMERTRGELGADPGRLDEAARSVYGSLHLRSAVLAARSGRRSLADAHLAEAAGLAATVGDGAGHHGANHYGMEFGPANVGLHRVSAAVELADGTLAVSRAREVERAGQLSRLPAVRVGHFHIEVARAWLYHGDRHRALSALHRARRVAPQQARYHPMVRDTVQAIAHAEPRPSEQLRSFAAWLGIDS